MRVRIEYDDPTKTNTWRVLVNGKPVGPPLDRDDAMKVSIWLAGGGLAEMMDLFGRKPPGD